MSASRTLRLLPAVVLLAAAGACGAGGDDTPPGALDLAVIPYSGLAATHLGMEKGLMDKHGLQLKFVDAEAPPAVVSQVVSGQVDMGYATSFSVVSAVAAGADLRIVAPVEGTIAPGVSATEILVPVDSAIRSPRDLAGRTHAVVALNSAHDLLTREVVERAGGDPAAVKVVQVPFPQMAGAVEAGDVDSMTITEPFRTMALRTGKYRSISKPDAEVLPKATATVWFASGDYVEDNAPVVANFQKAVCESITYGGKHPDELRGVIPTFTELEPELVKEITISAVPDPVVNAASQKTIAELMAKYKVIEKVPPMDGLVLDSACP